jgi:hypothetical protein
MRKFLAKLASLKQNVYLNITQKFSAFLLENTEPAPGVLSILYREIVTEYRSLSETAVTIYPSTT